MKLSETAYDNAQTGCCAPVDPAHWEGRELVWRDKPFLKDHIRAFLHVPLNFGTVMARDQAAIEVAAAYPQEPFWLTDEVSPWGSDIYVAVDGDVPNAHIERLSGTFVTRAFDGPYRDVGRWIAEMEAFVTSRGQRIQKLYFFYATCPKCAKALGKNQVVLFAQV